MYLLSFRFDEQSKRIYDKANFCIMRASSKRHWRSDRPHEVYGYIFPSVLPICMRVPLFFLICLISNKIDDKSHTIGKFHDVNKEVRNASVIMEKLLVFPCSVSRYGLDPVGVCFSGHVFLTVWRTSLL